MNTLDNNSEIDEIIETIKKELTDDKSYNITYLNLIIENFKNHQKILEIIQVFAEEIYNNLDESIRAIIGIGEYKKLYSKYFDCLSLFEVRHLISSKTDVAIELFKEYVNECENLLKSINKVVSVEGYLEYKLNTEDDDLYECGLNISKAYTYLGYLCVEKKEYSYAKECLIKALKHNQYNAGALFEYAEIFKIECDFEQYYSLTKELHNKIYKIADLAHYYRNLGFYYIEQKDYKLAKGLFNYSYKICETEIAKNELNYIAMLTNDEYPLGMSKFTSEEILRKTEIEPSFCNNVIIKLENMQENLQHFYISIVEDIIKTHSILSFNHSESKYCVQCGKVIPSDAQFCSFCGEEQVKDPDATCCLCDCGGAFGYTDNYCYACGKEIVRRTPEEVKELNILSTIEKSIVELKKATDKEKRNFLLIQILALLSNVQLLFPTEVDVESMLGNIDPTTLKKGDVLTAQKNVKMKFLTIKSNGEELIPAFTSDKEFNKGPDVSSMKMYFNDYYPIVKKMDKPLMINPFGEPLYLPIDLLDIVKRYGENNDEEVTKSDATKSFCVGSVLNGKYELLKEIGKGGSFVVYLAMDKSINKQWAVKIAIKKAGVDKETFENMALSEAYSIKSFNHPAIPRIVDIITEDDYIAVVQDYIEGATLDNIINEYGKQDAMHILDWSIQICDVLGYLHSLNPPHIYRDMKPANIILKPNGNISLVDFGVMRTYKPNQTKDTVALGTVGFAPPEQFGSAQTDFRSDIYALGMTMYSLYVGTKPNKDGCVDFGNEKDSLSKGLVSIIKKCTELNPSDRYQSCYELKAELQYLKDNRKLKKKFSLFNKK